MKKCALMMLFCLSFVACGESTPEQKVLVQQCGDYYVEMNFSETGDSLHAVINGDAVDLSSAVSASGARYVGVLNDTDVTMWGKGEQWTLFLGENTTIECIAK